MFWRNIFLARVIFSIFHTVRCKLATRYFIYLIIVMIKPIIYGFNILALSREPFDIFMSICYSWIKVPILRQILCLWIQHINIVFCHTREEFSNLATFERGNLDDHWKMTIFNQHVGLKFPKLFFCHYLSLRFNGICSDIYYFNLYISDSNCNKKSNQLKTVKLTKTSLYL